VGKGAVRRAHHSKEVVGYASAKPPYKLRTHRVSPVPTSSSRSSGVDVGETPLDFITLVRAGVMLEPVQQLPFSRQQFCNGCHRKILYGFGLINAWREIWVRHGEDAEPLE
jgi:hypothetical protein